MDHFTFATAIGRPQAILRLAQADILRLSAGHYVWQPYLRRPPEHPASHPRSVASTFRLSGEGDREGRVHSGTNTVGTGSGGVLLQRCSLGGHYLSPLNTKDVATTDDIGSPACFDENLQEGCFGRKHVESSSQSRRSSVPNVLVLGDIRRLLCQFAAVGGDAGGGQREAGTWNLRAPNVLASHIDTPQEVCSWAWILRKLCVVEKPCSVASGQATTASIETLKLGRSEKLFRRDVSMAWRET